MKSLFSTRAANAGVIALVALSAAACSSDKSSTTPTGVTSAANDWVTMGYDVQSTFHNTKETKLTKDNVSKLVHKWEAPLVHYDTSVIVGDTLYAGGVDGVHSINANSGQENWVFADGSIGGSGITGSMAYENNTLYVPTSSGSLVALDVSTNPPTIKAGSGTGGLWDVPVNPPKGSFGYSAAIVVGDLVLTGVSWADSPPDPNTGPFKGSVAAFHKNDGSLAWRTSTADANEDGCSVWGAVAVDPDAKMVYAPVGNNYTATGAGEDSVQAFDLTNGTKKWANQAYANDLYYVGGPFGRDYDFGANPVVLDFNGKKLLAAGSKSGDVFIWDRITGTQIQRRNLCGGELLHGGVMQGLSFDGQHLILQCNNGTSTGPGSEPSNGDGGTSLLAALIPDTLEVAWERQLGANVWSPITLANGVGYLGMSTRLEAFDLETGARLFQYQVGGTIGSGVTVSNGRIFFGSGMTWIGTKADGKLVSLQLP